MSILTILGINDSHDASACLVVNGKLVAAVAEERLQRIKGMSGFPKNAIDTCLRMGGIKKSEVDYVVFGSQHVSPTNLHNYYPSISIWDHIKVEEEYWYPIIYEGKEPRINEILPNFKMKGDSFYPLEQIPFAENRELSKSDLASIDDMRKQFAADWFGVSPDNVIFVDHHKAHAHYAYFCSPKRHDNRPILTLTSDGGGDDAYESIRIFDESGELVLHQDKTNLIANIYSYITLFLGMRPNEHEYKVMGLSAYTPEYLKKEPREIFLDALSVDKFKFTRNPKVTDLYTFFCNRLKGYRFDAISGGIQDFVEIRMMEWVRNAVSETGIKDIAYSGGLALNIKANQKIWEMDCVDSLFVPPGAGDESLSIGAAYAFLDDINFNNKPKRTMWPEFNAFCLGTSSTPEKIKRFKHHVNVERVYSHNKIATPQDVAQIISEGHICAVFLSNMEFGPRALGCRSIIADPSKKESVSKINKTIKMRDFWMPFTPSILDRRLRDYVHNPKGLDCSYMTVAFDTTELGKKDLIAAIHPSDFTVRPQSVTEKNSPEYFKIITEFEKISGIGAVLNTSLNIHGKPIVMDPEHIAEEILSSEAAELNYIYVDGNLFSKLKN